MKSARIALFLLSIPLASAAQSVDSHQDQPSTRVAAARCQYATADNACVQAGAHQSSSESHGNHNGSPCQPVPCSRPSRCCPGYYPRPSPPPFVFEPESGTHAAAGALIGFGLGAAAGAAKDGDAGTRFVAAVFVGGFGALVGAVIGHGIPSNAFHKHHRWDEDLEDDVAANPAPSTPTPTSATAGAGHPGTAPTSATAPERSSSP